MKGKTCALITMLALGVVSTVVPVFAQGKISGVPGSRSATETIDGKYLPPPPPKFGGVINLGAEQSKAYWPPSVVPPKGAPNVLLHWVNAFSGEPNQLMTRPDRVPADYWRGQENVPSAAWRLSSRDRSWQRDRSGGG